LNEPSAVLIEVTLEFSAPTIRLWCWLVTFASSNSKWASDICKSMCTRNRHGSLVRL
jgi:hypothetical protein